MENKKLLSYLLKDLEELDDLFSDKADFRFDELEIEFIQTRIKGARKLVQKYIEAKEEIAENKPFVAVQETKPEEIKTGKWEETTAKIEPINEKKEKEPVYKTPEPLKDEVKDFVKKETDQKVLEQEKQAKHQHAAPGVIVKEIVNYVDETIADIDNEEFGPVIPATRKLNDASFDQNELELEYRPEENNGTKRLGDSFTKDRSLNDLITDDSVKLEHKLSNMPVANLQSAIGINDRFQYIRELFDGNSDLYNETVTKLDSMSEIKDAVVYLQNNFKWKKTEVSLKFVNLLKRRFSNE